MVAIFYENDAFLSLLQQWAFARHPSSSQLPRLAKFIIEGKK